MEVTLNISSDTIANMMISAIESGDPVTTAARGGWCNGINVRDRDARVFAFREDGMDCDFPWYANPKFYEWAGLVIEITEADDEPTGHETKHKITLSAIQRGLAVMAEKCPEHFADVVKGETDAPCADSFLQCTVFGELKYG